jgi:hypothetical protein
MPSVGTPRPLAPPSTPSAFARSAAGRGQANGHRAGRLVEPKTSSVVPAGSAAAIRPSNATAGPTRRRIAVADAAQ